MASDRLCIWSTIRASCIVLHMLKFLDGAGRSTVQQSVAIVDSPGQEVSPTAEPTRQLESQSTEWVGLRQLSLNKYVSNRFIQHRSC